MIFSKFYLIVVMVLLFPIHAYSMVSTSELTTRKASDSPYKCELDQATSIKTILNDLNQIVLQYSTQVINPEKAEEKFEDLIDLYKIKFKIRGCKGNQAECPEQWNGLSKAYSAGYRWLPNVFLDYIDKKINKNRKISSLDEETKRLETIKNNPIITGEDFQYLRESLAPIYKKYIFFNHGGINNLYVRNGILVKLINFSPESDNDFIMKSNKDFERIRSLSEQGHHSFVVPYFSEKGKPMQKLVNNASNLDENRSVEPVFFCDLLEDLDLLYKNQIALLDIHPGNIVFGDDFNDSSRKKLYLVDSEEFAVKASTEEILRSKEQAATFVINYFEKDPKLGQMFLKINPILAKMNQLYTAMDRLNSIMDIRKRDNPQDPFVQKCAKELVQIEQQVKAEEEEFHLTKIFVDLCPRK